MNGMKKDDCLILNILREACKFKMREDHRGVADRKA